jgi:hypothetical protein
MSRTLRPVAWKRVLDSQVALGPVGAGLKLDTDSRAEDVIALVPEVERAIDDQFGIRYLADPALQVGHWFLIDGIPMPYGIPGQDGYGVLFLGEAEKRFIWVDQQSTFLTDQRQCREVVVRLLSLSLERSP